MHINCRRTQSPLSDSGEKWHGFISYTHIYCFSLSLKSIEWQYYAWTFGKNMYIFGFRINTLIMAVGECKRFKEFRFTYCYYLILFVSERIVTHNFFFIKTHTFEWRERRISIGNNLHPLCIKINLSGIDVRERCHTHKMFKTLYIHFLKPRINTMICKMT